MGEALNVGEPRLKLRQDFEHAIGIVFGAKSSWDFSRVLVRTADKSNGPRGEHIGTLASVSHTNANKAISGL